MACNDCNTPVESVSLTPNCNPIPPCTTACEETINSACVIYTGDSLTNLGVVEANPTVETIIEKIQTSIVSLSAGVNAPIIKGGNFEIKSSERIYYLRGTANNDAITRTITLPAASTFPVGTTWKFIFEYVTNTSWVFNTAINFGLASPQTAISTILGLTTAAKGTSALPSFNLTIIMDGATPSYMVYK